MSEADLLAAEHQQRLDARIEEQKALVSRLREAAQVLPEDSMLRDVAREDWRYEAGLLEGLRIARRVTGR